ncbi:hypothetical protein CW748_10765 [Alteromonadales bacterium alter-6D02]|nr:hypothetical protein CW748_10765 [Alteromonadales bacterium alter-6D02]
MKIKSGNQEVVTSGYLDSFEMNPVEFEISEDPKMTLKLVVENNPNETDSTITGQVVDESTMTITVKNPHHKLNFGPLTPIHVGLLHGRPTSLVFRINVIEDYSSYNVAYTFFSEVTDV